MAHNFLRAWDTHDCREGLQDFARDGGGPHQPRLDGRGNVGEAGGDVPARGGVKSERKRGPRSVVSGGLSCVGILPVPACHSDSWLCCFPSHLRRLLVRELLRLLALSVHKYAGEDDEWRENADQPFDWLVIEQEEDASRDDQRAQERAVPHSLDLRFQVPVHHSILKTKAMFLLILGQCRHPFVLTHDPLCSAGQYSLIPSELLYRGQRCRPDPRDGSKLNPGLCGTGVRRILLRRAAVPVRNDSLTLLALVPVLALAQGS